MSLVSCGILFAHICVFVNKATEYQRNGYMIANSAAVANELNKEDQREAALEAALETTPEKKLSNRLAKLRDKIVLELPQAIEQRETEQNWFESAFASIFSDGPITAAELAELETFTLSLKTPANLIHKVDDPSFFILCSELSCSLGE